MFPERDDWMIMFKAAVGVYVIAPAAGLALPGNILLMLIFNGVM
jgi:hypothetical protein